MILIPQSIATPEVIEAAKKICPGMEVRIFTPESAARECRLSSFVDGETFIVRSPTEYVRGITL